jgi:hypothetical protein
LIGRRAVGEESQPWAKIPWPSGAWRLEVAALAQDMHYLVRWFRDEGAVPNSQALLDAVDAHLESARYSLSRRFGTGPTSILGHLTAAQEDLLRLAPLPYVRGCLTSLVMRSRRALDADDLQLIKLQDLEIRAQSTELTEDKSRQDRLSLGVGLMKPVDAAADLRSTGSLPWVPTSARPAHVRQAAVPSRPIVSARWMSHVHVPRLHQSVK